MSAGYTPDAGDIAWAHFDPQAGHEQAGRRPALVLSPRTYNQRSGLMVCCPITNRAKGYPFEVPLPAGLSATGVVLSDQLKSFDWRQRNAQFLCVAPREIVDEVLAKDCSTPEYRV